MFYVIYGWKYKYSLYKKEREYIFYIYIPTMNNHILIFLENLWYKKYNYN